MQSQDDILINQIDTTDIFFQLIKFNQISRSIYPVKENMIQSKLGTIQNQTSIKSQDFTKFQIREYKKEQGITQKNDDRKNPLIIEGNLQNLNLIIKKGIQQRNFFRVITQLSDSVHKINRFKKALLNYNPSIQKSPKYLDYYYQKALTLNKMAKYQEALQYYDLAIQKDPENSEYYYNKANTLTNLNKFQEAIEQYSQAIKKRPEILDYYFKKALTLNKMKRYEEALQIYDLAIQKNPDCSNYFNEKGNVPENIYIANTLLNDAILFTQDK